MSSQQIAIDLIQRLPEQFSLSEIAKEIEFVAAVQEGFAETDRGEGSSPEEVRQMIPSWTSRS